jgi:hypothetical protein
MIVMIKIQEMVINKEEYRQWLNQKGLAANTINSYISYLNTVSKRINQPISPSILSSLKDVEAYLYYS